MTQVGIALDDIVDIADFSNTADARRTLQAVFELVWEAHDLAGAGRPREAAARLRQASTLRGPRD